MYTINYGLSSLKYKEFPKLFFHGLSIVYDENDNLYLYVLEFPGLPCRYNMEGPDLFKRVMFNFVTVLMEHVRHHPNDEMLFSDVQFHITLFSAIIDTGTTLDKDLQALIFKLLYFCGDIQAVITNYSEKEIDGLFTKYEGLAQCLSL